MKEGLWKRFKEVIRNTLADSLTIEKIMNTECDSFNTVTYRVSFTTLSVFDKKFWVILRWFRMKYKQAVEEIRNE